MAAKPWNMRPDETSKAYQAFEVYRDLGSGRSMEKVGAILGKSRGTIEPWAQRFDWAERVRAFDEDVAARAADKAFESAVAVRARQAQHAKAIQLRAMQKFAAVGPEGMSVAEATRAWQVGSEAERKALGIDERVLVLRRDEVPPEEAARLIEELRRLEAIEGPARLLEDHDSGGA